MAQPLAIPKGASHARSTSLPSRAHPLAANVEEQLCKLKGNLTEAASTPTASSICRNLCVLRDLYESFNGFLQLPLTQQALSSEKGKCAEDVLNGSLMLLDVCGTARDVLVLVRESVRELQSAFRRRRRSEESGPPQSELAAYMTSKKKINKMVSNRITNMKANEKVCPPAELLEKDSSSSSSSSATIGMCREVEAVTFSLLKSLLFYASGVETASKEQQSGWRLVSKLLQNKRGTEEEAEGNAVERMDDALRALNKRSSKGNDKVLVIQNVLKKLRTADVALNELEGGLEPIFRCLLKTRVSLLNTLGH